MWAVITLSESPHVPPVTAPGPSALSQLWLKLSPGWTEGLCLPSGLGRLEPLKSSFAFIPVGLGREVSQSAGQLGSITESLWS